MSKYSCVTFLNQIQEHLFMLRCTLVAHDTWFITEYCYSLIVLTYNSPQYLSLKTHLINFLLSVENYIIV